MSLLPSRWRKLSFRLPLLIAVFAALTGLVAGVIAYVVANDGFIEIAKDRMEIVRNERARAVTAFIDSNRSGLSSLVTRPGLADEIRNFSRALTSLPTAQREALIAGYTTGNPFPAGSRSALSDAGDKSAYTQLHKASHERLLRLVQIKHLDDLMLVDTQGNVVYSTMKEPDFGTNYLNGPLKDTNAARVFRAALAAEPPWEAALADMEFYGPTNRPAMFMAQAVYDDDGHAAGVLMFQLNNTQIRNIANHIQDLGNTGEVYLVGPDATRRSQTRFTKGDLVTEKVVSDSAARAAGGFTGQAVTDDYRGARVISAYGPVDIMGVTWGIVSKINVDEALEPLNPMISATLAGVLVATLIIALMGYISARRISLPLDRSLRVMDKLSRGDLNVEFENANGIDEIRQISVALKAFHANQLQTRDLLEEVRKNEEELNGLLDSSPVGVLVLADGNVKYVNDSGATILGKERSSFIGERFSFTDIALDQAAANKAIGIARRDGTLKETRLDIRVAGREQTVINFSSRRTHFKGQDAFLIWFNDITEQTRLHAEVETALGVAKNERARAEAILAGAPDPIIIVKPNGIIEYANHRVTDVLDYKPNDLVGRSIEILLPAHAKQKHAANMAHFFKAAVPREMGANKALVAVSREGREIPVEISLSPMKLGDEAYVIASVRDITERQKAATELRENQQLLSGVIQNSDTVIFVKRHGRYILVNKAWEKMTGISADQARNKTDLEIWDEPAARAIMENDARIIESGIAAEYEEPVMVQGKRIHFLSLKFPFFNDAGEVYGLCGMSTDITQRADAEKMIREARDAAEAATKAKSDFLASMSHEIRTPMNGITGMADLLSQTKLDDEQAHMVRTIRESGNALITVINDILDFSKIEAGKLGIEDVGMSLADAVEGVAGTLTPSASKKSVRVHVYVDPQLPNAVHGDPTRVRQILFNLGGNAIKFSNGNDVIIEAKPAGRADDDRTWVRFNVIDRGIGISKENQTKLFQAFSQAESSTTRRYGGTGLGLAICKRLVDLMGGVIGVESAEGLGSTFWVELPFRVAEKGQTNEKARDLHGLRVLLVGGVAPRADTITAYVRYWGADLLNTPSAKDANIKGFDVIMVDCGLDQAAQKRTVAELKKSHGKTPPIILLQDYHKRGARIADGETVTVDANPLIRYRIVSAVAVAAGRASPEVKKDEDVLSAAPAKAPTANEAAALGQLILLAEDNLTNQDVIKRQLALVGYACEIANNGKEALKAWHSGRYALLLTDCHMPEMDGYELTGQIRTAEHGTQRRTPIIAVTANALQGEAERCIAAGMDDYISKPIAMPALRAALKKWMPQHTNIAQAPAPDAHAAKAPEKSTALTNGVAPGQAAVIDDRAIKDTFGDDDATFKEILLSFVEPSEAIIAEIVMAWEKRNPGDVRDAAHKLKSAARSVGANDLADTCMKLEAAGKTADWPTIDALTPLSQTQMAAVADYIKQL